MRLQEPLVQHGATDCLSLHQILAVAPSVRKLSGWEASSLLLCSAPNGMRSGYPYPSHIDKSTNGRLHACLRACWRLFHMRPFLSGVFFFNSGGKLSPNVEAVSPVVRKLAFISKVIGLAFIACFLPGRKAVRRRVVSKNQDNLS